VDSFAKFVLEGRGTPAPIAPPSHLVIGGYYRYVRNPMYVAVFAIILGQALLFGAIVLVAYAGLVWFGFAAFVMGYEEPVLRNTFGGAYEKFCANVPRWVPRFTPWTP
jgi:protein-S-isoprenylcysteine O-methyltransferase Ste14